MKLLFDENLSPKLPDRLSDIFPNSLHVRDVGMKAGASRFCKYPNKCKIVKINKSVKKSLEQEP